MAVVDAGLRRIETMAKGKRTLFTFFFCHCGKWNFYISEVVEVSLYSLLENFYLLFYFIFYKSVLAGAFLTLTLISVCMCETLQKHYYYLNFFNRGSCVYHSPDACGFEVANSGVRIRGNAKQEGFSYRQTFFFFLCACFVFLAWKCFSTQRLHDRGSITWWSTPRSHKPSVHIWDSL